MKILLLVSVFGFVESYAGPRNYGFKVYKHVIQVTEVSLENPMPNPSPMDDDLVVAKVNVKYHSMN